GINHIPAWVDHRPAADAGPGAAHRYQRRQQPPLDVGGIRRVGTRPFRGQVRVRVGDLGCTVPGQGMDTQPWAFESGVAVWSLLLLLEGPLHGQHDTPAYPTTTTTPNAETVIYQALRAAKCQYRPMSCGTIRCRFLLPCNGFRGPSLPVDATRCRPVSELPSTHRSHICPVTRCVSCHGPCCGTAPQGPGKVVGC